MNSLAGSAQLFFPGAPFGSARDGVIAFNVGVSPFASYVMLQGTWQAFGGSGAAPTPANPTAIAGPAAVNGSATTYMRSDAAPAIQKGTNALFGIMQADGTSINAIAGVLTVPTFGAAAPGIVPLSGGGTTNFLRADGTWAAPSAGGGGISSITDGTNTVSGATNLTVSGGLTVGGTTPNATLALPTASGTTQGGVTLDNVTIKLNGSNKIATAIGINTVAASSYTFQASDWGKLVLFTNTGGINPALPQAGSAGFPASWYVIARFTGGGSNIITPTVSTIDGLGGYTVFNGGCIILVSDGTNYQAIPLIGFNGNPSTNTGYSLQMATSTAVGGNSRGLEAVDLQLSRSNAAQVASGGNSFCVGNANKASGSYAFAGGDSNTASGNNGSTALGESGTASGQTATTLGQGNTAAGTFSTALGNSGTDNTNYGAFVVGYGGQGGSAGFPGRSQTHEQVLWFNTAGATAVRLTADGNAAGAHNVCSIQGNSSGLFTCDFIAINRNTGDILTYTFGPSLIANNGGTVTMGTGNPAAVAGPTSGTPAALGAVPTITADNVNKGFNISVTPPVGNVVNYVFYARIKMLENWWQ